MEILDGKTYSQKLLADISADISSLTVTGKRPPRIDMILVGDGFGSSKYVGMKEKAAKDIGMDGVIHRMDATSTTEDVLAKVSELNAYDGVDGFMVQLPLPVHINEDVVLESIAHSKDVDGLTSGSLGRLFQRADDGFAAATPMGIMLLLKEYDVDLQGKNVVIVGRSKIVGLPLVALMLDANATVTIAHSRTLKLTEVCQKADVLVVAAGKPKLINTEYVKDGAVVIDVGINRDPETGLLIGDVDFETVSPKCSHITPVPGGVGPMTIAALMWNTVEAWKSDPGSA